MVNAEGYDEPKGSIGKISTRRVIRYLQISAGPLANAVGMLRDI